MSQPCKTNCDVSQPGQLDEDLDEFWVGNPFEIFMSQNLSCFERNRMFLNNGAGDFVDVSYPIGIDADSDGRSSVPADIDGDGMQDLILRQAGGGALQIQRNLFPPANYLKVSLNGKESNRQGIGSRIIASVNGDRITREVYPVNTYRSQRPLVAHFGLAKSESVSELVIQWPSGQIQTLHDVAANQHIEVTEGSDEFRQLGVVPTKADSAAGL